MVAIPGGIFLPRFPMGGGGASQTTQTPIDADADGAGNVLIAPRTGDIQEFAFATATVTTGGDLDCRMETLDSGGLPSGTLFGTNTNVTKTVDGADDNAWLTTGNFTANAAVTAGVSKFALILQRPTSGAFSGNIKTINANYAQYTFPYGVWKPAASWARGVGASNMQCLMAVKYSDGVWEPLFGTFPFQAQTTITLNTGASPDEVGCVFNLPFKYRAAGAWLWTDTEGANGYTISFYDNADLSPTYNSAQAKVTEDSDEVSAPTSSYCRAYHFNNKVTVAKNTLMRLAVKADTATSMAVYRQDFFSTTYLALAEGGDDIYYTSRTDETGEFSDVTTQRLVMGLIIDQIDDGDGSGAAGGLLRHPGMQGGILG